MQSISFLVQFQPIVIRALDGCLRTKTGVEMRRFQTIEPVMNAEGSGSSSFLNGPSRNIIIIECIQ
jgi:hypothetical protein